MVRSRADGFTMIEVTIALGIVSIIGLVSLFLFQGTSEMAAGQRAQRDAESEASQLLDKLARDFAAHSKGTVASGCGSGTGTFSHQLSNCAKCAEHDSCRFLRIWRGDAFLKQNFADPRLDPHALNYWTTCVNAPKGVPDIVFPSNCKKTCAKGKVPVVHFSRDNGSSASFVPQKTHPVGLTNGTSPSNKAVGMELCLSQEGGGLTAQATVYYLEAKELRRFVFTSILPVTPTVSGNLEVMP